MRNIFKILLTTIIISLSYAHTHGQEGGGFDRSNLVTGGNLSLQFGNYTVIDVSPILGYRFTDKIMAGVGGIYQYYSYKDPNFSAFNFQTDIYGGKLFGRYYFLDFLFAHGEYELLSLETEYFDPLNMRHTGKRFNVHSVLVGAGYAQLVGRNSAIYLMVLYNLNETVDTPYSNPVFRIGFDIGL